MKIGARVPRPVRDHLIRAGLGSLSYGIEVVTISHQRKTGMDKPIKKGFNCKTCGRWHNFGPYVAAHSRFQLTHTCQCGAKHVVHDYQVTQVKKGRSVQPQEVS